VVTVIVYTKDPDLKGGGNGTMEREDQKRRNVEREPYTLQMH
jgi:hypothetical protein